MASDGRCGGHPSFQGFALSLTVRDEREADRLFAALVEGGQVIMPLTATFFSPRFGMTSDRFGVSWMVYVEPHGAAKGSRSEALARELALFKVSADGSARAEVMQICEIFRAKIVDVTKRSVVVEVTGTHDKIEAFEGLVRPFGLVEMARTGEIAIARGRGET